MCPISATPCDWAAMHGHLPCLQHWHRHGHNMRTTFVMAAQFGHLNCMRYVRKHSETWHESANNACRVAAKHGNLHCMRYAHRQGATLDANIMFDAMKFGHLDCVRYAHKHGAPWGSYACNEAAYRGHMPCLRYALKHGAPTPIALVWARGYDKEGKETDACFRYLALHCATVRDPELAAWCDRVRTTAATIMRIVRLNRGIAAINTIKSIWVERYYADGGRGMAHAVARLNNAFARFDGD